MSKNQYRKKAKKEVKKGDTNNTNYRIEQKIYNNGNEYFGEFKNNRRDGWGIMTYYFFGNRTNDYTNMVYPYDWVIYSGFWKRGEPHGEGKLIFPNDSYCKGIWKKGYIQKNNCEYKYNDGRIYIGNIVEMHYTDLFHITPFCSGWGTMYRSDGSKKYEGNWMSFPVLFSISSIFSKNKIDEKLKNFSFPHGHGTYFLAGEKNIENDWKYGCIEDEYMTITYLDDKEIVVYVD
jgi:hypothetical protein